MGKQESMDHLLQEKGQQRRKSRVLMGIFAVALLGFVVLLYNRPPFPQSQAFNELTFPPTPQQLYAVSQVLVQYKEQHQIFSLVVFIYLYTLLQAFAIPGPIFLCVICPALWGPITAYSLCLCCSCLGASLCYLMSYELARSLVIRKFPALFAKFNSMVSAHRHNMFWYMLFLRLTPLVPNWFVNLASPLVGMRYIHFLTATFFGLMPNNFILIQTGLTLKQIDKIGLSFQNVLTLLFLGFLSLIPTFFKKRYEPEVDSPSGEEATPLNVKQQSTE